MPPTRSSVSSRETFASRISSSTTNRSRGSWRDSNCPCSSPVSSVGLIVIIACGYHLSDYRIEQLNAYLDEKKAQRIDLPLLLLCLTYLKELELQNE